MNPLGQQLKTYGVNWWEVIEWFADVDRYVSQYEIVLIDINARRRIASGHISGGMPGDCPATAKVGEPDIVGPAPTAESFLQWLKKATSPNIPSNAA